MSERPPMTWAYRLVLGVARPIMAWCRLDVRGADLIPGSGATLVVANHDSYWDPIAIAVAARGRRQIRALAKSTIWKVRVVGWLMDSMGHIPIERGASNEQAILGATEALRSGVCIGVFPEGTRSLGRELRAHSGAGRLVLAVPETEIVCVRVTGTTDVVRFPHRPHIRVEFFRPAGGPARHGESAGELMTRLLDEIRAGAPRDVPGRARTARKHRSQAA